MRLGISLLFLTFAIVNCQEAFGPANLPGARQGWPPYPPISLPGPGGYCREDADCRSSEHYCAPRQPASGGTDCYGQQECGPFRPWENRARTRKGQPPVLNNNGYVDTWGYEYLYLCICNFYITTRNRPFIPDNANRYGILSIVV